MMSAGGAFNLGGFGALPYQFLELIATIVTKVFKNGHTALFYQPAAWLDARVQSRSQTRFQPDEHQ